MIKNVIRKLKNRVTRYRLYVNPKIYRPSSKPFISGDSFRKMANHIFDETKTLNVKKVKKNDIVFVRSDLLKYYFENYHSEINQQYILISHNSDEKINRFYLKYIDDKIIHWFCFKLDFPMTTKITPIPAGLENKRYRVNGLVKNYLLFKNSIPEQNGILCSFNENTNYSERKSLKMIALKHKEVSVINFETPNKYLNSLINFKYNLCPDGNGGESHRIWESLIFNITPIVINNQMNLNFFNLGVPFLMLDSWSKLKDLNQSDLDKLNKLNEDKSYEKFSSYKFWFELVNSKKQYSI